MGSLVGRIVEDSARLLQGKVEKKGEQIKRYFRSLRPEVGFIVTQNEWKASLGVTPSGTAGATGLFVDALNGIEELAADQPEGRRVALIIDEFQELLSEPGIEAEKQIRSAVQTHKHTAYIFAGSKTRMLSELATDPSRPFYRLGELLFIGELPRTEFARFLIDNFIRGGFLQQAGAEEENRKLSHLILDLSEDVPFNVQMFAHTLWDHLSQIQIAAPEKAILNEMLIKDTLDTIIRRHDPFYTQVWNGLTAIQKKALHAVIAENGEHLQSLKVVKAFGVSPSSMRKSLESLTNRDVLRQVESAGTVRFCFEDPFFAHWIDTFTY